MEMLAQDVRHSLRSLARSPGFTVVAVLTLTLGIGSTTALFSIVHGVVLKPLPYEEPDRLVMLWEHNDTFGRLSSAWANFVDWRAESRSFEAMASFGRGTGTVLGADEAMRASVASVSEGFFRVMGVDPAVGRTFAASEHVLGGEPAAMISQGFWQQVLGGADIDELRLVVDGFATTIVGVLPAGFDFPAGADIWYPLELQEQSTSRTAHNWRVVGRLAPGVEPSQAQEEISLITSRFVTADDAVEFIPQRAEVVPLRGEIAGPVSNPLFLLLGASVMVVLVACTNLASTLLARGSARGDEIAVLRAIGAERGRIVRRLFTESMLLALFGAVAGLLFAAGMIRVLPVVIPTQLPRMTEIEIQPVVAGFTVAVSVLAALLFGLFPALRASDTDIAAALRRSGRSSTSAARSRGPWRVLVVGEVALALALLAGAGLLMRSFWNVASVDGGFESEGVITARVSLPPHEYGEVARRAAYFEEVLEEVRSLPGIDAAGVVLAPPLSGIVSSGRISVDGGPQDNVTAAYQVADEGYFEVFGIPLIQGRLFAPADNADATHVVVVDEALAELAWPGENPLGKRITGGGMDRYWNQPDAWATVIGVVGNVLQRELTDDPEPTFYFSHRQRADRARGGVFVVRPARGEPSALAPVLRRAMVAIDADVPVEFSTMDELVARSLGARRFTMSVLGAFAGMAALLAGLGIYGVVGYTVALRTREMGIRIALGSAPMDVLGLVMREAMTTVAAGLLLGVVVTLGSARVLGSMLYEVSPADPLALTATALALLTVAGLASFIPARRAATIDPLLTMRGN